MCLGRTAGTKITGERARADANHPRVCEYPSQLGGGLQQEVTEAIRSVNMHHLGVNFVDRVLDVRRRHIDDGKAAAAPGESLEFLRKFGRGNQRSERREKHTYCS